MRSQHPKQSSLTIKKIKKQSQLVKKQSQEIARRDLKFWVQILP